MKKLFLGIAACAAVIMLYAQTRSMPEYPELQNGDLIFQSDTSGQSTAVSFATASLFTHTGLIKRDGNKIIVIEAVGPVTETPIDEWIDHGLFKWIAIYRDPTLSPEQTKQIVAATKQHYDKPYDKFFLFDTDAIYCSELPYLAYKQVGISIGAVEKVSQLHFDNPLVKRLIKQRWQSHPECREHHYDFEQCYSHILNQELITPASISRDTRFKLIFSNYPL